MIWEKGDGAGTIQGTMLSVSMSLPNAIMTPCSSPFEWSLHDLHVVMHVGEVAGLL